MVNLYFHGDLPSQIDRQFNLPLRTISHAENETGYQSPEISILEWFELDFIDSNEIYLSKRIQDIDVWNIEIRTFEGASQNDLFLVRCRN